MLSSEERAQLVAFLTTLSSEDPPRPQSLPAVTMAFGTPAAGVATTEVGQRGRRFTPDAVTLAVGAALTIVNDDGRTHNVRLDDPRLAFVSGAQEPGDRIVISFPEPGRYRVTCGIHPAMKLDVAVTAP